MQKDKALGHEHDAPMVWAVSESHMLPVYIRDLSRERAGLKCACVCPECGAKLQAVNAGRPDEHFLRRGVHRPHFRHHSLQQSSTCRSSTARLVALHLLAESDELDLPPPSATSDPVFGLSGQPYTNTSQGSRMTAKVVSREWIDRQKAVLHLSNGKTIAIVLVSRTFVDAIQGVDGVLVVEGDDPEVANMDPADLLRHVQLDGKWLRWIRHWEDRELLAEAQERAQGMLSEALDSWPEGLDMPAGLSPMQRSESVLHWALKEALAGIRFLGVPGASGTVPMHDHQGILRSEPWAVEPTTLRISNARLESTLGDLVPDIVCAAVDPAGVLSNETLLIEVAVTHKVGAAKLRKIQAAGYACLEIDATRLAIGGRIQRKQLPQVLQASNCMQWLHHPSFQAKVALAKQRLNSRLTSERQAEERWQRTVGFLEEASEERLYQALLTCLETDWQEGVATPLQFEGVDLSSREVIEAIGQRKRGFSFDSALMGSDGVLHTLRRWQNAPRWGDHSQHVVQSIRRLQSSPTSESRFITLLLSAVKVGMVSINGRYAQSIKQIREEVWGSLRDGVDAFARPDVYEAFIAHAVPALRPLLQRDATTSATRERYSARQMKEWTQRQEIRQRQEEARAQAAAEESKRQEMEARKKLLRTLSSGEWQPVLGICQDVAQAKRLANQVRCYAINRDRVIESAWAAREGGQSPEDFYRSFGELREAGLREISRVLNEAYLKL